MASHTPLEDQTDEDFFDKLVDEDFQFTESRSGLTDEVESDEANAFANLSITDGDAVTEDFVSGKVNPVLSMERSEKDILVSEDSVLSVPSNSATSDAVTESGTTAGISSDQAMGISNGSRGNQVKEVQWSLFSSNSAQTDAGGFGSNSDFFSELADGGSLVDPFMSAGSNLNTACDSANMVGNPVADSLTSDSQAHGVVGQQTAVGQDLYSSQYWENAYPGWRYDPSTGEWHQLDGYDTTENAHVGKAQSVGNGIISDGRSEVSYLQQTAQSVMETVTEGCMTSSMSNSCDQVSQGPYGFPAHMVFDPQYPGWYYDTIAQEWRMLEAYTEASQATSTADNYQTEGGNASSGSFLPGNDHNLYNGYGQSELCQTHSQRGQGHGWNGSGNKEAQPGMWESEQVADSGNLASSSGDQQNGNLYGSIGNLNTYRYHQTSFKPKETILQYGPSNHGYEKSNGITGFQSTSAENLYQVNQLEQDQQMHSSSPDYYASQSSDNYSQQQQFHVGNGSYTQFPHASNETRSSAGHPAHALVTFGFGGKLIVVKNSNSSSGSQDPVGGSVSILNLMDVVMDNTHAAGSGSGARDYFFALCQQSFPGPLVGGNTSAINKWTDERIANCESPDMDVRKGELLRLLLSLLKISCQHYGKLRSPFGVDPASQETDGPESAVAKLFASAKRNGAQLSHYGAFTRCMQNLPSEGQSRETAVEVQNLLVSGRRKEALQCAQEGQLWGPALVLAAQLGEKFYVDTVKQMAYHQFVSGSPLRTLCLLIAGQPADVFSGDGLSGSVNMSLQPAQFPANGMLDDWEENLAIITANRTKDDGLVMIHLGDCLWKERGEIAAAHTCYLVAEANFESYSDSARMCLVGADHWKLPRTYATPDAIQRTELYEYSRVLGNPQFILLPFQPYKLIYAYMLAEVGKVSDSLRYCQAVLKMLKNSGRLPEVETWKSLLSSLEDRIRTHQQGGYSTNLAPAKLVGKLFTSIDRSIHRMIGAPHQPASSTLQMNNEHDNRSLGPKVVNSQSTMAMSSLMQSASMEPISAWQGEGNRMSIHNRSISEPNFGRSTKQDWGDSSREASSTDAQGKASIAGGPSRFGLFGSQILQKTMGWVSRSRPDRQAKLGEKNKFYYDEKLKRWVEEGADPPAEEAALPPPPTASFQNGMQDRHQNNEIKSQYPPANGGPADVRSPNSSETSSGIPPVPPSTNQFSARSRMGVRSRYVDTFHKGGGTPTNLFQSPPVPAAKPAVAAKFFVPAPASLADPMVDTTGENTREAATYEDPSTLAAKESTFPSFSSSMQHSPSMDNVNPLGNKGMVVSQNSNGPHSVHSRAASWSGNYNDPINHKPKEIKPLGEMLGMPPSPLPSGLSLLHPNSGSQPANGGSYGDLHEVEL